MPDRKTNAIIPNTPREKGMRDWADNISGEIVAARLVAFNAATLLWQDAEIDNATGNLRVTAGGTTDTELEPAVLLADGAANPTITRVGSAGLLFNGTTWDRVRGDITNGLDVDVTRVQGTVVVDSELTTADLDTGAGVDTRAVVGLVLSASGGGVLAPGDGVNGLDVDVTRMPAAARTTDHVGAAAMTDAVMSGLTALTPKFAKANVAAATTDAVVVAAVASKKIRPLLVRLHAGGTATNVTFNSKPGTAGVAISELFALGANGGRADGWVPVGYFETVVGEGLTVTTGAGATTGIGVVYVEV